MFSVGKSRRSTKLAIACTVAALISGCASWVGPDMIRAGRPAYNSAILATGDEQLLQNIVRTRFYDSVGFLAVTSVTANIAVTASATVQAGFGPSGNYAGNLVPFSGVFTVEQNPTISYTPLAGDELLRHLGAETTMERAFLMLNSAATPEQVWSMIVRRINNLRNPDFPDPPLLTVDPGFEQVVATASLLQRRGVLSWVQLTGKQNGYGLVIHSYLPSNLREVEKLLSLLGLQQSQVPAGDDIVIPVQLSVGSPDPGSIAIETRSLFDMLRIAGATIELAPDTSGVGRLPAPGPAAGGLRIRSGSAPPAEARVATQYRGRWYYIGDDELSKQWFTVLHLLAGAPAGASTAAPVLTIPVTGRH